MVGTSETEMKDPDVVFKKKVYEVNVSIWMGLVLAVITALDFNAIRLESPSEGVPSEWHTALLYMHILSFYLLISGLVVCNETNQPEAMKLAYLSLVVNLVSFVCRFYYEYAFIDFHPTTYYPAEV